MSRRFLPIVAVVFAVTAPGSTTGTDNMHDPALSAPIVIAHRAGSGLWPQNSRTGVLSSVAEAGKASPEERYQGIEVDVVLTRDGVPVLSHEPWVHKTLANTVDGKSVDGEILIKDLSWQEFENGYRVGGVQDPEFPDVQPVAEKPMSLDELLAALEAAPNMTLYLDVKIQPPLTASPEAYAQAIFERWDEARLPNRLYVEGPTPECIAAYDKHARSEYIAVLSYPPFYAHGNWTLAGGSALVMTRLGLRSPLRQARKADADAVALPTQIVSRRLARRLAREGIRTVIFTPNTRQALDKYCAFPIDGVITDYPNLGSCGD
jgi:glycerophosphoryl diester phosphodiesterase